GGPPGDEVAGPVGGQLDPFRGGGDGEAVDLFEEGPTPFLAVHDDLPRVAVHLDPVPVPGQGHGLDGGGPAAVELVADVQHRSLRIGVERVGHEVAVLTQDLGVVAQAVEGGQVRVAPGPGRSA